MTSKGIHLVAVLVASVACSGPALPADIVGSAPGVWPPYIWFTGEIVRGDAAKFQRVAQSLIQSKGQGSMPIRILLDSPGGDAATAMTIGRYIRANDMGTMVNFTCVSSCIFLHAAGVTRYANYSGARVKRAEVRVGVHRPYYTETRTVSASEADAMHKKMDVVIRAYFKEMNIPETLADAMLRIPPENVRYLTVNEQEEYGLYGADPGYAQREATKEAIGYELTVDEYYARLAQANAQCSRIPDPLGQVSCKEGVMRGVSAAEAERRFYRANQLCPSLEPPARRACPDEVMRGARK